MEMGEEEGSEERKINVKIPVVTPSKEEVRRHRLTHCPCRSWCEECVCGAANMEAHRARSEPLISIPEIHSDYAFFTDRKEM